MLFLPFCGVCEEDYVWSGSFEHGKNHGYEVRVFADVAWERRCKCRITGGMFKCHGFNAVYNLVE